MKRHLALALVIGLVLTAIPMTADAADVSVKHHGKTKHPSHGQANHGHHHYVYRSVHVPQVYYVPVQPSSPAATSWWHWDGEKWWYWDGYRWVVR